MAIKLNGIFKDGMVFQWGAEVRIFGSTNSPLDMIIRAFIYKEEELISKSEGFVDKSGCFLVCLPPVEEPGGPYKIEVSCGQSQIILSDCYAGEVWLAAGQSNMEYPLQRTEGAKSAIKAIKDTEIRFYNVPAPTGPYYDDDLARREDESKWVTISAKTAGKMSGVAYYFANAVSCYIGCKIGIIGCYLGGTSISCWMSEEALKSTKSGSRVLRNFNTKAGELSDPDFDKELKNYKDINEVYKSEVKDFLKGNPYATYAECDESVGPFRWPAPIGWRSVNHPGSLFKNMVKRIAPFLLRGVIFYQGESDCDENAKNYGQTFASLISEWRHAFYYPDMPFVFCQLPMYISKEKSRKLRDDMKWPTLREQQQLVAIDVHNTYMAVLADCGEFDNLHPSDKKTPGERLACLALKYVYEIDQIPALAPYLVGARMGNGVELTFDGDFGKLKFKKNALSDLSGFELAENEGKFYPATATISPDGRTVYLKCPDIEFPAKVRYAYGSFVEAPLSSDSGLPVAPFSATLSRSVGSGK